MCLVCVDCICVYLQGIWLSSAFADVYFLSRCLYEFCIVCVCVCVCVYVRGGGLSQSVFGLCVWHLRLGIEELGSVGSE